MSDYETEKSFATFTTSEEVAWHIKAVSDLLKPQMASLCELMREFRKEQSNRRHHETASFRATGSLSGRGSRCYSLKLTVKLTRWLDSKGWLDSASFSFFDFAIFFLPVFWFDF